MNEIFSNLYLYEIVLLFLGIFLFMLLCAALVYFIIRKDDLKKLLFFFPIPILMIAYPSIQEIQIEKDKFELRKYSDKVIENPEDTVAKKELIKVTEKLEKRATTIADFKAVAEANLILGNPDKTIDLTDKAIKSKIENPLESNSAKNDEVDSLTNADQQKELKNIQRIKDVATIQKELKRDPSTLRDTIVLKQQIGKIKWGNPKTEQFLNTKIIQSNKKTDTTKTRVEQ